MNEILKDYLLEFGEFPTLIVTANYDDDIYQKLMAKALCTGKKITDDDLNEAFKNVKYDHVESTKIKIKEKK